MKFVIEGKPQPKQRPRVTRHGTYTPQETRAYETNVAWLYKLEGGQMMDGPVNIIVIARFKIPKSRKDLTPGACHTQRPDLDNVVKCVTDGLNGVAYKDDSQLYMIAGMKMWSDRDAVEVEIREGMNE